ncbi:MAG: PEP/pyruvate-binding domain-containing protein, partial [Candidatus Cloacimonetes bacterium]|nr:PEP/pyruvate-binding domain-containing protein [Candidatus Cloacimonadota bacterium]
YKRHIAAGIPSMYGMYREPKLEAMGLVFRLENVIRRLFERSIAQINLNYLNGKTLRRISRILEIYDYAMKQEMVTSDAFASALQMLASVQHTAGFSLDQYLDIFKLLKDSVNEIINEYYYRFYDSQITRLKAGQQSKKQREIFAEEFYRSLLSNSFLVQGLDNFITRILESLTRMRKLFKPDDIARLMSYDPDRLFFHLHTRNSRIENQVLLGSKAYFLKRMYQYEYPIPPGFVITTDLYRCRAIINAHPDISEEFDKLLKQNLNYMENYTGLIYGDAKKPLLLSVRSGAPMSLPGAMDTFLNIGLNDEICLKLSQRKNYGWTAWDCYRRLIQSWGMAYGIERDEFDKVMIEYKKRYGVDQKTKFTDEQMRLMVDDYKAVLSAHKVSFEQDPFLQLYTSISHVLDSWNTDRAKLYRSKLHIAEEWGTAVIVQKMVLGNISLDSGTGVLFTHADWHQKPGICLNGDFTLCSQGEDVVAGLVHTLPISETERLRQNGDISLQKDFPDLYQGLLRYASGLIEERAYPHQEMEFTFEGNSCSLLYILQTRNQVIQKTPDYCVLGTRDCEMKKIATGIGIGKGALNGIIVFTAEDIAGYKDSGEAMILVRPDTVPDDMQLLFECQGLLTSRGGVTSHAAVTATRLGLIGVVNCRELVVNEEMGTCTLGGLELAAGAKIALDATGGAIYQGHYLLQSVHKLV